MDSSRLVSRRRIRPFLFTVQAITVESSGRKICNNGVKISASRRLHENLMFLWLGDAHLNAAGMGSPDEKAAYLLAEDASAKRFPACRSNCSRIAHRTRFLRRAQYIQRAGRGCGEIG